MATAIHVIRRPSYTLYYGCGTRVRWPPYIYPNGVKKGEKQKKTVVKTKERRIRTDEKELKKLKIGNVRIP